MVASELKKKQKRKKKCVCLNVVIFSWVLFTRVVLYSTKMLSNYLCICHCTMCNGSMLWIARTFIILASAYAHAHAFKWVHMHSIRKNNAWVIRFMCLSNTYTTKFTRFSPSLSSLFKDPFNEKYGNKREIIIWVCFVYFIVNNLKIRLISRIIHYFVVYIPWSRLNQLSIFFHFRSQRS